MHSAHSALVHETLRVDLRGWLAITENVQVIGQAVILLHLGDGPVSNRAGVVAGLVHLAEQNCIADGE